MNTRAAEARLRLSISPLRAELPRAVGGARDRARIREGLAVRLEDEDGCVGLGEASPLPGFSRESLGQARAALESGDLVQAPSARFAYETAEADLRARRAGLSLARHLAGADATLAPVRAQALIDQLQSAHRDALDAVAAGATALKIKIGRAGHEAQESAALRALALALAGKGVVLRADANGLLPLDSALPGLLAELGFELLEDPFPLRELRSLAPLPLPVGLDEAASADPAGALSAIEEGRAQALVLKPALVGGLRATRALAAQARERGASVVISHLLEGPIGLAASAHLALALGATSTLGASSTPDIHGLAPWLGLEHFRCEGRPVRAPAFVRLDGIAVPSALGLGVTLA